jgi:hypothetical protein
MEENIEIHIQVIGCKGEEWIKLALIVDHRRILFVTVIIP